MKALEFCEKVLRRAGEKLRERFVRGIRAARSFSVPAWCRGIVRELREELTPFSWRRGLRYYRGPLILLLVFCVLWATPVVLANTAGTTLFYWWPDYVTIPVSGKRIAEYIPFEGRMAMPYALNFNQDYFRCKEEKFPFSARLGDYLYPATPAIPSDEEKFGDVLIVCKAKILQLRLVLNYEWEEEIVERSDLRSLFRYYPFFRMISFFYDWNPDSFKPIGGWIYFGRRVVAEVEIEDVFFDPYDLYEKKDKFIMEVSQGSAPFMDVNDRAYIFLSYPRECHQFDDKYYNLGIVDSSDHYDSWFIMEGQVSFEENSFPIRSEVKELRNTFKQNGKIYESYNEIYTEEEIDRFLRENLTVQEDLWRAYVEENLR